MAGCTVLGASEFVPAAYEVYKLNASPDTIVWTDDIREMSGLDMLRNVGLSVGELDILDGSPPCAAFSTAGKRSEGWGEVKKYSDTAQRVDDLFYEYARILKEMQPRAFIAENVEGLVKGSAKGYFKRIHVALSDCGYQVCAAVLDASWLGVPQARRRLIFYGLRNDLGLNPKHPEPLPHRYALKDVFVDSGAVVLRRTFNAKKLSDQRPMMTITTQPSEFWLIDLLTHDAETNQKLTVNWGDKTYSKMMEINASMSEETLKNRSTPLRMFNLQELRSLCSFPADFELKGTYFQRWERLGRSVPPVMMKNIALAVCKQLGVKA